MEMKNMRNRNVDTASSNMVRTSICILKEDYEKIKEYSKFIHQSISKTFVDFTLEKIKENEIKDMLDFLNEHCSYVDDEEQREFDEMELDFEDFSGTRMKIS